MKTINTNKPFLKLLTITGALSALLLSGCGGGGGSTQSTLPNEGKAVNSLGYYGDGVYFGSKPILGTWESELGYAGAYHAFKNDGTVTVDYFGYFGTMPLAYVYGVNANATQMITLKSTYETNDTKEVYNIENEEANCFAVRQLTYRNDLLENNISMQFCTKHPSATLDSISNVGKASNTLGFYGEGVKLGNDLVMGNWIASTPNDETLLFFDANGTAVTITFNQFSDIKCPFSTPYGISEDGKSVYEHSSGARFEIIGLSEGCYHAKDGYNKEYKLCKSAIKNTSWTQSCNQ